MSQLILRNEALSHCELFEESSFKILMIQAQGGQGKTVLATQFDEASATPFAWITCTRSTNSPRQLFEKILTSIGTALPSFSQEAITGALQQQLADYDFIEIASQRLQDELERCNAPVTLVLDDTHLLEDGDFTKQLLKRLVEVTPSFVKFVFLTRFPLMLEQAPLFSSSSMLSIDKSLLAFSREEIAILFNDVFQEPTDTNKIKKLHDATEGWISGLKLLHTSGTIRRLVHADTKSLGLFFDELLLPSLSPAEYREMILLAFLDELPEAMLRDNASLGIVRWIEELVAKNCFARVSRGESERIFRLHHIFQEYLLSQAEDLITREEQTMFLEGVGDWYLDTGMAREGLECYAKSESWDLIADTMKEQCLPLLGANQHHFLLALMNTVPHDTVEANGWLSFALGSAQFALNPPSAGSTLEHSTELFRQEQDVFGELLACCTLLNYQVLTSGEYGKKSHLVNRAATLYEMLADNLPIVLQVNCAQALAVGKSYYEAKLTDAQSYIDRTKEQFKQCAPNSVPWYKLVGIVINLFEGKVVKALDDFSPLFSLANSPLVSPTVRFTLLASYANATSMQGMSNAYEQMKNELHQRWGTMMTRSHIGADISTWELDRLISRGHYEEAYTHSISCPLITVLLGPHCQSKNKAHQAIALACLGRLDEMDSVLKEALRLRAKSGGPFYVHLVHSLAMAALTIAGRDRAAKRIYTKCTRPRDKAPSFYHDPLLHACISAIHLKEGNEAQAEQTVGSMLTHMQANENKHSYGLTPRILKQVLSFAVKKRIHTAYARMLAKDQLNLEILDDGSIVPLLEIRIIGDFRLKRAGIHMIESDLSPAWIQLIKRLALAPDHEVETQTIQRVLWPDEEPAQSRSKFDTMLSRIRAKMSAAFGKDTVAQHLRLQSGKLALTHCLVDSDQVASFAKQGCQYSKANTAWRADTAFSEMAFWIKDSFLDDAIVPRLPGKLVPTILEALVTWATVLESSLAQEKALTVISKALAMDAMNDELQRRHYNLLTALKRPTEAAKAIKSYRQVLLEHDFNADDIDHIIDNLLAEPQKA